MNRYASLVFFAFVLLTSCDNPNSSQHLRDQIEEANAKAADALDKVEELEAKVTDLEDKVQALEDNQ